MEIETNHQEVIDVPYQTISSDKPFIQANTVETTLIEIKEQHTIPVFIKDNEPAISHSDFIEISQEVINDCFCGEQILRPNIRLSHPIKGRIPEAKLKPANELLDHEKTLYYERMMFVIEIPSIQSEIDGNKLSLCFGGVKAFNLDNLYAKKGSDELFKIFIGFKNRVCTNLCVWTDGYYGDVKVRSLGHLKGVIKTLITNYNHTYHLHQLKELANYQLTEQQFALLIGRCRMYHHLPYNLRMDIPPMLFGDTQINAVCKDYYKDDSFCRDNEGNISLWKLYNLFTGANKSSYIDNFVERNVNASSFIDSIRFALKDKSNNWFLN